MPGKSFESDFDDLEMENQSDLFPEEKERDFFVDEYFESGRIFPEDMEFWEGDQY